MKNCLGNKIFILYLYQFCNTKSLQNIYNNNGRWEVKINTCTVCLVLVQSKQEAIVCQHLQWKISCFSGILLSRSPRQVPPLSPQILSVTITIKGMVMPIHIYLYTKAQNSSIFLILSFRHIPIRSLTEIKWTQGPL